MKLLQTEHFVREMQVKQSLKAQASHKLEELRKYPVELSQTEQAVKD